MEDYQKLLTFFLNINLGKILKQKAIIYLIQDVKTTTAKMRKLWGFYRILQIDIYEN